LIIHMLIAKIDQDKITVKDYRELFPNTSFSSNGPNEDFFVENNCMKVTAFKAHDANTQKMISCDPYIEDGQVFVIKITDKTPEELLLEATQQSID